MARSATQPRKFPTRWRRAASAAALLLLAAVGAPASANQVLPPEVIVQQLLPSAAGSLVRSMTPEQTRGIRVDGPLPPEFDLPKISLVVNFEFDTHRLTNDGMLTLRALAAALNDARLDGMRFQIAGHTDGRGDDAYNQALSERRARTVVEHLNAFYGIAADRLVPVGYGKSRLADSANPNSAVNRRVEIINLAPLS